MALQSGFNTGSGSGTTPGRSLNIYVDTQVPTLTEPSDEKEVSMDHIATDSKGLTAGVRFIPEIGWRLSTYQYLRGITHETAVADAFRLTPSNNNAIVASNNANTGMVEVSNQRYLSELSTRGVPQGSLRTSGDLRLKNKVASSDNFPLTSLQPDMDSFPGADTGSDLVPMFRAFIGYPGGGTSPHKPNESLAWSATTPTNAVNSLQRLDKLYFTNIPGYTSQDQADGVHGIGDYCLIRRLDGIAELFELVIADGDPSLSVWVERALFNYAPRALVPGTEHQVMIHSDAVQDSQGNWSGTKIVFEFINSDGNLSTFFDLLDDVLGKPQPHHTYRIPNPGINGNPNLQPVRVDLRPDARANFFYVDVNGYVPSGTLTCHSVALQQAPFNIDNPINVQWFGDSGDGNTSVSIALYDLTGTACTPANSYAGAFNGGAQAFNCTIGPNGLGNTNYYAVLTLSSGNGYSTPTIRGVRYIRDVTLSTPNLVEATRLDTSAWFLTGAGSDPTEETLAVDANDLSTSFPNLTGRAQMGASVIVNLPNGTQSQIFRGYEVQAPRRRRGSTKYEGFAQGGSLRQYPAKDWGQFKNIRFVGEWMRLMKAQTRRTLNLANDLGVNNTTGNGQGPVGFKVTDAIRYFFQALGYPSTMIDVPDYPIRFFGDAISPTIIEPFSELGPLIVYLARNYLGAYIVFDANATNGGGPNNFFGCWRLRIPLQPPYNNLAQFLVGPNNESATITAIGQGAYIDGAAPNGQPIKATFMRKDSSNFQVIAPDCNMVFVTGIGYAQPQGQGFGGTLSGPIDQNNYFRMSQQAINWVSAPFWNKQGQVGYPPAADPNSADYLGYRWPFYKDDPALCTPEAINFAVRREYDLSAHALKVGTFEAPYVFVTDIEDKLQIRPRPLRFGDPVFVQNSDFELQQFYISSVQASGAFVKGGSRFQHAVYEVCSLPALQNYFAYGETD